MISCLGNVAETWNLMFHSTVSNPHFFIQECPQSMLFPHNYPKKDYTCIRRGRVVKWGRLTSSTSLKVSLKGSNSQTIEEWELTHSFSHVFACISVFPPFFLFTALSLLRWCITGAAVGPSHWHTQTVLCVYNINHISLPDLKLTFTLSQPTSFSSGFIENFKTAKVFQQIMIQIYW